MSAEKKEETALTARTPLGMVKQLLSQDQYKKRFEEILRDKAPQFMASITNQMAGSYQLQKCKPESVIAAAFIAATLDLPIDKNLGYAWIIPYGQGQGQNKTYVAQFQMGWKGYVQLALRSGCYQGINAFPVNEEARGRMDPKTKSMVYYDEIGDPIINFDRLDKTKPAVGYGCAWRLTTGFVKVCYWTKEEVQAHSLRYSQAVKSGKKDSPWFGEFDKMALKTVLSNSLRRWGIMSIETRQMQQAMSYDQGAQDYIDAEVTFPDGSEEEPSDDERAGEETTSSDSNPSLADQLRAKREAKNAAPETPAETEPVADSSPSPEEPKEATEEPADDGGMAAEDELRGEAQALYDRLSKTQGKVGKTRAALQALGVATVKEIPVQKLSGFIDTLNSI
jgi:recombination protein RecT